METATEPTVAPEQTTGEVISPVQPHKVHRKQSPFAKAIGHFFIAFSPNEVISAASLRFIVIFQIAAFLLLWLNSPFIILPKPIEVWQAFQTLVSEGLIKEIATSLMLNLDALVWTIGLALLFSYATVMPFFRPLVNAISKGRFLSLVGFTLVLTIILGGGHPLKMSLLVFGMTVFFVTSMASAIADIPKEQFDYARTLRMSEWKVVWEVVILGTADRAFEILRQNAAIGWMMLTMVEGISRAEGGVGAMLLNQQKHMKVAEIFAIQICILLIGLAQDFSLGALKRFFCPYASITLERKS
jgi:NitT/TauT family transport system permease protein